MNSVKNVEWVNIGDVYRLRLVFRKKIRGSESSFTKKSEEAVFYLRDKEYENRSDILKKKKKVSNCTA